MPIRHSNEQSDVLYPYIIARNDMMCVVSIRHCEERSDVAIFKIL